jgi:hypothetical protein
MVYRLMRSEFDNCMSENNLLLESERILRANSDTYVTDIRFEVPDRLRVACIRALVRQMRLSSNHADPKSAIHWKILVCNWGTWPTEESPWLLETLHAGLGDSRSISHAPTYCGGPEDELAMCELTRLFASFGWGFVFFTEPVGVTCGMSHDGWISVQGHRMGNVERATAELRSLGLSEVLFAGWVERFR